MQIPENMPEHLKEELEKKGGIIQILEELPSESELKNMAKIHQALSDKNRLKIMFFLYHQSACVCLLREITSLAYSKLSYHLKVLRAVDLIDYKKSGNYLNYSLTDFGKFCIEKCIAVSNNYQKQK